MKKMKLDITFKDYNVHLISSMEGVLFNEKFIYDCFNQIILVKNYLLMDY